MGQTIPGQSGSAITPNDSTDLARVTRGLIISVAGTVKIDWADGTTLTLPAAMAVGVIHPIAARRIYATGTTATGIIGVY